MYMPLYGLCVDIAKETFSNRIRKEAMPDRPVHEQSWDFARGLRFQQHVIFQAAV